MGELDELKHKVERQREDLSRQIRNAEKATLELSAKVKQAGIEHKSDVESLCKKEHVNRVESSLQTSLSDVEAAMQALQQQVVRKLNEFVDHFGRLHETMDDHEHCLRHHAEEIENRSTKYDFLNAQRLIDQCASKEEFDRESTELKRLMNWQSNKIEGFGLSTGGAA